MYRLTLLLLLMACGKQEHVERRVVEAGTPGADGKGCTVTQYDDGANVECPDGTTAHIYHGTAGADGLDGTDGKDGQDGVDGKNGTSVTTPIYVGYYCSRVVLKLGNIRYVNHGQLIPLNDKWLKISSTCEIRFKQGKVETK